ncbi:hypothetical protein BDZ91DRAFT_202397 [Kalaharituber pfeilii]|nr:hypothetical protein BDZ91DRAFT_202397 [Kalaharituber pfeilii]
MKMQKTQNHRSISSSSAMSCLGASSLTGSSLLPIQSSENNCFPHRQLALTFVSSRTLLSKPPTVVFSPSGCTPRRLPHYCPISLFQHIRFSPPSRPYQRIGESTDTSQCYRPSKALLRKFMYVVLPGSCSVKGGKVSVCGAKCLLGP